MASAGGRWAATGPRPFSDNIQACLAMQTTFIALAGDIFSGHPPCGRRGISRACEEARESGARRNRYMRLSARAGQHRELHAQAAARRLQNRPTARATGGSDLLVGAYGQCDGRGGWKTQCPLLHMRAQTTRYGGFTCFLRERGEGSCPPTPVNRSGGSCSPQPMTNPGGESVLPCPLKRGFAMPPSPDALYVTKLLRQRKIPWKVLLVQI